VGKTSYGKGLVQSIRPLPYNGQMKVTTAKYYTPSGRCVQGVGVKPDVEIDVPSYSRLVYSLVLGGVIDQYVLHFARNHDSIAEVDEYHFSDEDFEDFISFAKTQDFDYRSSAKATFDKMKEELEEDGLTDVMSEELAALEKALEMDKERFIRLKKDEIVPFIEEEIVTRYWFQEAGVKIRLRYDRQLAQALEQVSTAK
jgi:carboxyl-terminal processing protease